MDTTAADKSAIVEVVNNWVIWSDSGDFERFATVWHDDAWMTATWFQGPAREFVEARKRGFERGVSIIHFLGAVTCDVVGARAIAQSKMTIGQRAAVDGGARRRRMHRPLLRLFREACRPLGDRPPAADL